MSHCYKFTVWGCAALGVPLLCTAAPPDVAVWNCARTEAARLDAAEDLSLPPTLDYHSILGLSQEAREKLSRACPINLGQASRLSGITPADITVLMVHLKKKEKP